MDVCSNGRARLAGLCVVWIAASCGLYACGEDNASSDGATNAAPDLSDIPISPSIDELPEGTTALVGRVLDLTNNAPIVDAVVSSTPPTELVRTNARGEYVLISGLVDRQVYTVGVTEPRYMPETVEVRAVSEVIREANMYLFPDGAASLLTPVPGGVELSGNRRRAVVFLTSPSDRRVGIGPCLDPLENLASDWLKVNAPNGFFYRNNPGAVELLVDTKALDAAIEEPDAYPNVSDFDAEGFVEATINMCDTDSPPKPIQITARVQRYETTDPLGVVVSNDSECPEGVEDGIVCITPTENNGERTYKVKLQPTFNGEPILGEAVECKIGGDNPSLPATVTTTVVSDNTGTALCEVTLSAAVTDAVEGRASLTAYGGVDAKFRLEP